MDFQEQTRLIGAARIASANKLFATAKRSANFSLLISLGKSTAAGWDNRERRGKTEAGETLGKLVT